MSSFNNDFFLIKKGNGSKEIEEDELTENDNENTLRES